MNHDNDYAPDVNYGNRFPDDYYFINEKDSLNSIISFIAGEDVTPLIRDMDNNLVF